MSPTDPDPGDRRPTVVFLIGNQALPRDRRVWQECRSVQAFGCRVIAISRTGTLPGTESSYDVVEGIPIHRYPMTRSGGGVAAYGREFAAALWQSARLLRRVSRQTRVDVVHAGNPPDFLVLAGLPLKRSGTRLIFDHHDLSPELYAARTGRRGGAVDRALRALERLSFRAADLVIATNETYRRVAIERGAKDPDDVVVVRNGPDLTRFHAVAPDPSLKHGKPFLLAYAGVMGRQDGLGHALRALAALHRRRRDWHAVLAGQGEVLPAMRGLARERGIEDAVTFTGWIPNEGVLEVLSTADVCLAPDPPSPANDASTMIKIMEYMALARPVVSFDLPESRVSAGAAARFARGDDVEDFARHIAELLDDPAERARLGDAGRRRVTEALSWQHSERALRRAYDRVLAP
jgi:glycosyltransferase involved in cell wall biosynthesis